MSQQATKAGVQHQQAEQQDQQRRRHFEPAERQHHMLCPRACQRNAASAKRQTKQPEAADGDGGAETDPRRKRDALAGGTLGNSDTDDNDGERARQKAHGDRQ